MPRPIIAATAAATTMVGMIGSRRLMSDGSGTSPLAVNRRAPAAPDVDRGEQEQPDDVDEMPVPGGRLEPEMLPRREVALVGADQAYGEEDGADDHVEAVEAGRHEEGRAVDIAFEGEWRVGIFPRLDAG